MAADISVKIALDGERDYRNALKNCNDALKNADSALKAFDESAKGNEKSVENLQKRQELLSKALDEAKKKQETLTDVVDKAKAARDKAAEALAKAKQEQGENSKAVADAEKKYIAANNAVDRWETKLNKANEEVAKYTNEMNGATDETENFQKVVGNTAAMEALTKIADKVSGVMKNVNSAMRDASKEIETGLKQINKRTGASGAELEKYQRIATNVFTSIPTTIDTASDAVGELATRFKNLTDDQLANLTTAFVKFADLNETDVASAVDTTQKAMAAFGVSIDDAGQLLDVFNRAGQNTGVSASDLASKLTQNAEAFQQMGMDIYQAVDFLGQLEISGADSSAVLMGMKTALKNATDEGKPFNEALAEMQESILNGTEGMDGLNYAYDIFGTRSGAQVYNAVKNGTIDFQNLADTTDILRDAQDNLNQTYDGSLTVYDKFTVAQNALKGAADELQGEMNKALAPAVEGLAGVVKDVTEKFKELPPEVQTTIGIVATLGGTALEVAPQIASLITQILTLKAAKKLTGGVNGLTGSVGDLGTKSGSTAKTVLGVVGGLFAFGAAATAAGEAVKANNEATVAAGASIETNLINQADAARAKFEDFVVTLGDVNVAQAALTQATEMQTQAQAALDQANADSKAFYEQYPALLEGNIQVGDSFMDSMGRTVTYTKDLYQQQQILALRVDEAGQALNSTTGLVTDANTYIEELGKTTKDTGKVVDTTTKQSETAVKKVSSSTQKQLEKVSGAVNSMKDALTNGAKSITNWFDKVSEKEKLSADELAANLQGQIDSMKDWQSNLTYLADKGINQSLLQYLADMGPEGAAYVQAFVDAANGETEVGLDEMNRLWIEKLDLDAGYNKEAKELLAAVGTSAAGTKEELDKLAVIANDAGEAIPEGVADGIYAAGGNPASAVKTMNSGINTALTNGNFYSNGYDIGANMVSGIVKGINNNADSAVNAAAAMANRTISKTRNIMAIASPSKVFEEIGMYLDQGLAKGINKYAYAPDMAMTDTMKDLVRLPDLSRYDAGSSVNNEVRVYIGDKELTAIMAAGVVKNISTNQRARYAAAGG